MKQQLRIVLILVLFFAILILSILPTIAPIFWLKATSYDYVEFSPQDKQSFDEGQLICVAKGAFEEVMTEKRLGENFQRLLSIVCAEQDYLGSQFPVYVTGSKEYVSACMYYKDTRSLMISIAHSGNDYMSFFRELLINVWILKHTKNAARMEEFFLAELSSIEALRQLLPSGDLKGIILAEIKQATDEMIRKRLATVKTVRELCECFKIKEGKPALWAAKVYFIVTDNRMLVSRVGASTGIPDLFQDYVDTATGYIKTTTVQQANAEIKKHFRPANINKLFNN